MNSSEILIVEDEAVVALDVQEHLQQLGYTVAGTVDSGEEAIQVVTKKKPDVVLMDIILKGKMDGITTAIELQKSFDLPIVFLTAYADERTLSRAKLAAPYGYVIKPFDRADLRAGIDGALLRRASDVSQTKLKPKVGSLPELVTIEPPRVRKSDARSEASPSCDMEFLRSITQFSKLPDSAVAQLKVMSRWQQVPHGEYIVHEGDRAMPAFAVVSGWISLLKSSPNGKELIVDILTPADIFALIMALSDAPAAWSARALVDSQILVLSAATLGAVLREAPAVYEEIAKFLAERIKSSHNLALKLAHERVEVRVASSLLALRDHLQADGRSTQKAEPVVPLTRQELALLAGTTPETVSRIVCQMQRDGILDLSLPGVIKITDNTALENYFPPL